MSKKQWQALPPQVAKNFYDFYHLKVAPEMYEIKPLRDKYLKNFFTTLIGSVVGGVLFTILILINPDYEAEKDKFVALGCVMYFYIVFAIFITLQPLGQYAKAVKPFMLKKILGFFGDVQLVEKNQPIEINKALLERSELFSSVTNTQPDDSFVCSYKGSKFWVSEQKFYGNETAFQAVERSYLSVLFVLFETEKPFVGKVRMFDKQKTLRTKFNLSLWALFGGLYVFVAIWSALLNGSWNRFILDLFLYAVLIFLGYNIYYTFFRRVHLEDVLFSKQWSVEATDQIEARCILTPAVMERMLQVKHMFNGARINFAFFDNKVLMAMETAQDLFETSSLLSPQKDFKKNLEAIEQLYSIYMMMDVLQKDHTTEENIDDGTQNNQRTKPWLREQEEAQDVKFYSYTK